ncbi:MAG: hypothetical protein EON54_07080 [Alcaligenaceae bacterium]|nr:MAG: hypothetical protein EON54_07080 [Alcaligenaceae bacterium]
MTTIRIEGAALQSAQTALSDAAKQFASPGSGGERSRNLTLSEVIGQLQGRRAGEKSNPLAANVKEAPELTAPTQKAMLLAMTGAGDDGKGVQRASGNYAGPTSGTRSSQAGQLSGVGAQSDDFDSSKLRGAAALRFWIAKIQETVDETTQTQLVDTLGRFKEQNKAQREFHDKKSEEIQKKEVAAQKASQVMGCLGKIVGAAVVAVSVAAAVVSGGTSLVLAGVGLGVQGMMKKRNSRTRATMDTRKQTKTTQL